MITIFFQGKAKTLNSQYSYCIKSKGIHKVHNNGIWIVKSFCTDFLWKTKQANEAKILCPRMSLQTWLQLRYVRQTCQFIAEDCCHRNLTWNIIFMISTEVGITNIMSGQ